MERPELEVSDFLKFELIEDEYQGYPYCKLVAMKKKDDEWREGRFSWGSRYTDEVIEFLGDVIAYLEEKRGVDEEIPF